MQERVTGALTAYETAKPEHTLSKYRVTAVTELRDWLNTTALAHNALLLVMDNGYCTQTVFGET
ncbi:MAG: hypothetical protein ACYDBB_10995 [Armatimonadota bacterium]